MAVLEQWKPDLVAYKPIGSAVVVKTKGLLKHLALQVYTPPPRSELLEGEVLICRSVTLDADHNPLAILDNRAVAIGETYRGVKVVDITSGYVLVDIQGKRERLVVGGSLTIPNP
ncbi:MAG: hypothetical protein FJ220_05245 [Kiritimatiellaceae bacterium]|nr:hypothetical protein [Kiritimatiellaceae bacterium]